MPECTGNPAKLNCPTCKGFKGHGICSHVLAINHMQGKIDVEYLLGELSATKANNLQGGGFKGRRALSSAPALEKQRHPRDPDSSDEEEELRRLTV